MQHGKGYIVGTNDGTKVPFTGVPSVDLRVRLIDDPGEALRLGIGYAVASLIWSGFALVGWYVLVDRGILPGFVGTITRIIDDSLSITMTHTDFTALGLAIIAAMMMALMAFYSVFRVTLEILSNAAASSIFLVRAWELRKRKTGQ